MLTATDSKKKLLIVEQSAEKRRVLSTFFSNNFDCSEADSVESALDQARRCEFAVALTAVSPPEITADSFLSRLQTASRRTVPVFLSETDTNVNGASLRQIEGYDVVQMPVSLTIVESAVEKAYGQYELKCIKEGYQNHLEDLVTARTSELDRALDEIENSYRMTLKALVQALEARDLETHGHSERAVTFSLRLGYEIGLDKKGMRDLELGALLHDIGKIGVPDAILHKPSELSEIEWAKMKLHPVHGRNILRNIPFLEGASRIVAQHHERWDGSGYPCGLRGEAIDIGARIFAVVDAFDAMLSERSYRDVISIENALSEIEKYAGTQFDPLVVEAFSAVPKGDWEILFERSFADKQEGLPLHAIVAALVYSERQFEMVH